MKTHFTKTASDDNEMHSRNDIKDQRYLIFQTSIEIHLGSLLQDHCTCFK